MKNSEDVVGFVFAIIGISIMLYVMGITTTPGEPAHIIFDNILKGITNFTMYFPLIGKFIETGVITILGYLLFLLGKKEYIKILKGTKL